MVERGRFVSCLSNFQNGTYDIIKALLRSKRIGTSGVNSKNPKIVFGHIRRAMGKSSAFFPVY